MVLDMRMIPLIPLRQSPIGFFTAWSSKLGNFSLQDHVRTDAFEKMHKLKFLQFNKVQVNGSYKNFPKGLRWLCWSGFPEECIPNEFPMGNVVSIDMRYSSLKQLWNGYKVINCLYIHFLWSSLGCQKGGLGGLTLKWVESLHHFGLHKPLIELA